MLMYIIYNYYPSNAADFCSKNQTRHDLVICDDCPRIYGLVW